MKEIQHRFKVHLVLRVPHYVNSSMKKKKKKRYQLKKFFFFYSAPTKGRHHARMPEAMPFDFVRRPSSGVDQNGSGAKKSQENKFLKYFQKLKTPSKAKSWEK
jgi:hypothetical protein